MTIAWGSFCVLIKWSMRLRCGGWPQWSVIIPPKTVVCSEILTTDPVLKRNSNYQRERKPGETGENLPQIRVLSKKKSPGKRSSSDSYGGHYFGTMCLFAGGQVQKTYLIMEATSAAKSSSFFSMPSPVSKRVNALTAMEPPSCLATSAMCFSTEILFSLTKACCSRQFSS